MGNKKKNKINKTDSKPSKWKKYFTAKTIAIYTVVTVLGTISGFFDSIVSPIYNYFFPEKYIRSEIDNKIRGKFLSAINNVNKDSLDFIVGSSITRFIGLRWGANDLYQSQKETYRCFFPNEFILTFQNSCPLMYKFGDDGSILFTGDIPGYYPETVLALVDSQIILDDSKLFTWNGDDYGFELIDKDNKVLFSVDFVPPYQIWIQGVFNDEKVYVGLVNNSLVPIQLDNLKKLDSVKSSIKPIFKYTGKDWHGKRADNYPQQ